MRYETSCLGAYNSDALAAAAVPLLEAADAVVSGLPVEDCGLKQIALSAALQAVAAAAAQGEGITNRDVISAFGTAYVAAVCAETKMSVVRAALVEIELVAACRRALVALAEAEQGGVV